MIAMTQSSDTAILSRVIEPARGDLSREAAESILRIRLSDADRERLDALGVKARDGELNSAEEDELESYRHAARVLELLKSKARHSLRRVRRDA